MTATITQLPGAATEHVRQPLAWESVRHVPGLTYRMFDYWARTGLVTTDGAGSGNPRTISPDEIRVVERAVPLTKAGITPATAFRYARELVAHGYVWVAPDSLLITAGAPS